MTRPTNRKEGGSSRLLRSPVGITDTTTGEILDLTPLKKPPRKPTRARVYRPRHKRTHLADSQWFVALLALLVASIAIVQ